MVTPRALELLGALLATDRARLGVHVWPYPDATGGPSVHVSLNDDEPLADFRADTLEAALAAALEAIRGRP